MLRRHVFVAAVFLSLIFSATFTSSTSNAADTSGKSPQLGNSYPPDTNTYSRPAVSDEQTAGGAKGSAPAGFLVVDIPNSGGGEPDIAINPLNTNQIVVHAGFGGWNGSAPNFSVD